MSAIKIGDISNNNDDYEEYNVSPNFEYEEDIVDDAQINFALIDSFEAFMSIKDGKPYIIYQNKDNKILEVLKVLKNKYKQIAAIQGHNANITCIKYFLNKSKNIEYLISCDYNGFILITNITQNFKMESSIKTKYKNGEITSCLMIFEIYDKKFDIQNGLIFISNKNSMENQITPTKEYILLKNGTLEFYHNFDENSPNNTSYLLYWDQKKNKQNYIITIGIKKIYVRNISSNDLYAAFGNSFEIWSHCGYVFYDKDKEKERDLLFVTTIRSLIFLFDLNSKNFIKAIKTSGLNERLYSILQWNSNYILACNATGPDIKVIDIKEEKCVGNNYIGHEDDFRCMRKIKHPKFGFCIITGGDDYSIKLFKPKCL